jgi:hypothetical protein
LIFLSKFCCRKETWGHTKVIHKKRKKVEKNGQVSEILKTMGTQMPPEKKKKEMNKIVVFSHKNISKFQGRCMFSRSKVRLTTIYIHHTSIHMHILI